MSLVHVLLAGTGDVEVDGDVDTEVDGTGALGEALGDELLAGSGVDGLVVIGGALVSGGDGVEAVEAFEAAGAVL